MKKLSNSDKALRNYFTIPSIIKIYEERKVILQRQINDPENVTDKKNAEKWPNRKIAGMIF